MGLLPRRRASWILGNQFQREPTECWSCTVHPVMRGARHSQRSGALHKLEEPPPYRRARTVRATPDHLPSPIDEPAKHLKRRKMGIRRRLLRRRQRRPHIHVAGTVATDANGTLTETDDPYEQTIQAIKNIQKALRDAGAALDDGVRTRMYGTNIDHWKQIGNAHGEFFDDIRPTTSMVEVRRLIEPDALVEIEADALCETNEPSA